MLGIPVSVLIGAVSVLVLLIQITVFANLYRRVQPNEALIVYGFRGTRIVTSGGTVIYPLVENYKRLSLELMSIEVAPVQSFHTSDRAIVAVDAAAQVKVKSNLESIHAAAQWFLSKTLTERQELIRQMMESRLRTIIAHLEAEQAMHEPERLADQLRDACTVDIDRMGLEMVSFRIKEIREQSSNH